MTKKEQSLKLPTLDDLFTTEQERIETNLEKVMDINIDEIDEFPNHPFKVQENEKLLELSESIKEKGVLVPALVRKKEDGRYELVSGHRRKKASEMAGIEKIPCIVRNMTDDEAIIIMVDSNMQREELLPSEKAFAYKMKLEAIKHQGIRNDLTLRQVGTRSDNKVAESVSESARQIQRFIRLTYLIPELLEMVDNKTIALNPAVELSYLKIEEQQMVLDSIGYNVATPSHQQAILLKNLSKEEKLNEDVIDQILSTEKPNQKVKIKFDEDRLRKVLPKDIKQDQIENYVIKSIEHYRNYLRQKNRDSGSMYSTKIPSYKLPLYY